jgi:hypothetical protein
MEYFTFDIQYDGFGAQYQRIIHCFIYCKMKNLKFLYRPFDNVEHNYDNDSEYNSKLENLINLKNNIQNFEENQDVKILDYGNDVLRFFENNIDDNTCNQEINLIKDYFWQNKNKNYFNNNKINIALHIRRENCIDKGLAGARIVDSNYFLKVMDLIRLKYKDCDILFHIYSQGELEEFKEFENKDVCFYINYDVIQTFIGMVSANILVMSPSSFSYVAALISDGEIYYYKKFWHKPKNNWIICDY